MGFDPMHITFPIIMFAIGAFAWWEAWKDYRNGRIESGRLGHYRNIDADRSDDPSGFWQGLLLKVGAGIFFIGWGIYTLVTGELPDGG